MAAPTVLQSPAPQNNVSTPIPFVLTGVTDGSTLVLMFSQATAAARTYTCSDNVNGAWTAGPYIFDGSFSSRHAGMFYLENVVTASGSLTVTLSSGASIGSVYAVVVELSECTVLDSSSNHNTAGSTTTHYCAASGALDAPADAIILSGATLHAAGGTLTPTTGFTALINAADCLWQYKASDAGFTDERSQFSSSTARQELGVSMVFQAPVVDTTPPTITSHSIEDDATTGNELWVNTDEAVTGDHTGLILTASGGSAGLTYLSGSGTTQRKFTIDRPILISEAYTLEYVAASGNTADLASNAMTNYGPTAGTNNSSRVADTTAPTLTSISISGDTVTRVFDEPVTGTNAGWTLSASGGAITEGAFSGSGTDTLTSTASRTPASTESLSTSYDSGTGDIVDGNTNALASITNRLVTNNVSGAGSSLPLIGPGLVY